MSKQNDMQRSPFAGDYRDGNQTQYLVGSAKSEHNSTKRKKHHFLRFFGRGLLVLLTLIIAMVIFSFVYGDCPNTAEGHKRNVSTVLIAGTDESGLRTDTLILLCADRSTGKMNLMSIPRDTRVDSTYVPHKINLAYQCNGMGEEGMYWLLDYVRQCIGFRPDGYVLMDLDCVGELVELFGGIDFDVPCEMKNIVPEKDIYVDLQPGWQHLNGEEAKWLVRFRSGYAMADLKRVQVQRDLAMEMVRQWITPRNVIKIPQVLEILQKYCQTDLSNRNLMWFLWSAVICGTSDSETMTIPYYLSASYVCIDADEDYLDLINTYFNPYSEAIGFDDLNIVGGNG